jgi:purine nucleosidase
LTKIIIDTDIGDDVDDALALAFALRCPELNILGVTTVYKNTALRAELAAKLLALYGRSDIPAVQGITQPLARKVDENEIPAQCSVLEDSCHNRADQFAPDFIVSTAMRNPGLNIVTLGPLSNLAACIQKAPEVMKNCRLTIMGGMTQNAFPEGNISSDPEAAKIVFESGIPISMLGLDVTLKCSLSFDGIAKIRDRGLMETDLLYKLIHIWKQETLTNIYRAWGNPPPVDGEYSTGMHDPMTIAFEALPSLFKTKSTLIAVETAGEYTRGITVERMNVFNRQPYGYNTNLVTDVQREKFMELFLNRILRKE